MAAIVSGSTNRSNNTRQSLDGSGRSVVKLKSAAIGRGEYLPGWRWSKHAGPQTGIPSQAHIGYIVSGKMVIRAGDGQQITIGPGEAFEVQAGHDAWVFGDEPCIALDFEYLGEYPGKTP